MRKLLKSFKTEINPTIEQKIKINKTIGTCRYVYNFYLGHNKTLYDNGEKFMTGKSPQCICCQILTTRFSRVNGRFQIILVDENLGF